MENLYCNSESEFIISPITLTESIGLLHITGKCKWLGFKMIGEWLGTYKFIWPKNQVLYTPWLTQLTPQYVTINKESRDSITEYTIFLSCHFTVEEQRRMLLWITHNKNL